MLALATIEEVTRLSLQQRVAILVDGTEKAGVESAARAASTRSRKCMRRTRSGRRRALEAAAYGPSRAPDVIHQSSARLVTLRALPVEERATLRMGYTFS